MANTMYVFRSILLLLSILGIMSCNSSQMGQDTDPVVDSTFSNPLLAHGADPWVFQYENTYYYTHTTGNRIDLYKTTNLAALSDASVSTVWRPDGEGENIMNIWAPEIHRINDKWYIYYTAGSNPDLSTQRSFVIECAGQDPMSDEWVDKGRIYDHNEDFFSIDGSILDYKGSYYFIWSGHPSASDNTQNIYISRMENPWTLATPRQIISTPTYDWEKIGDPKVNEGPEMLKNEQGDLMIVYSASGCWTDDYALGLIRYQEGEDILDMSGWKKSDQPVFTKEVEDKVYAPGHNGFFLSPDGTENWIIYHANSESGAGCTDARSPRMQKFTWNDDGTPDFGKPVKTGTPLALPSGTLLK